MTSLKLKSEVGHPNVECSTKSNLWENEALGQGRDQAEGGALRELEPDDQEVDQPADQRKRGRRNVEQVWKKFNGKHLGSETKNGKR